MDSKVELLIKRAENELFAAEALFKLSEISEVKTLLKVPVQETFYNSVIGHAYYSIFYGAKAYLIKKAVALPEQGQHQAVYSKGRSCFLTYAPLLLVKDLQIEE